MSAKYDVIFFTIVFIIGIAFRCKYISTSKRKNTLDMTSHIEYLHIEYHYHLLATLIAFRPVVQSPVLCYCNKFTFSDNSFKKSIGSLRQSEHFLSARHSFEAPLVMKCRQMFVC